MCVLLLCWQNEGSEKAEEAKEAQEGSAQDAGAEAESSASAFIAVKYVLLCVFLLMRSVVID